MAEAPKRGGPVLLGTSATAVYTAGAAATWSILRTIFVVNEDTVARTFTLGINNAATDASGKRAFGYVVTLQAGQSWDSGSIFVPLFGHASTPDVLYGLADAASKVTVTAGIVDGP